jgi:hypothetical protein
MTHNEFDFYKDLIRPMQNFFVSIKFKTISLDSNPSLDEIYFVDQDFERYFRRERLKMKSNAVRKNQKIEEQKSGDEKSIISTATNIFGGNSKKNKKEKRMFLNSHLIQDIPDSLSMIEDNHEFSKLYSNDSS